MAVAREALLLPSPTAATFRSEAPGARLRRRVAAAMGLVASVRFFTREFDRPAVGLLMIGAVLAAWDIMVPLVGAWVVDAMAARRPFQEVTLLTLGLAALIWVPHGNLLPFFLELYDLRRFKVRLLGHVACRSLRLALLGRGSPAVASGADAQPILIEGRENLVQLATRVTREVPVALRGIAILGLLVWMVPMFVPILLLGAFIDLAITWRMGVRLEEPFRARQDAENAQRRLENGLIARHVGQALPAVEVMRLIAPYEAAVRARVAAEIAAETRALRYRLARDLVFNVTNMTSWVMGAWYVLVAGNPLGSFLFFVAWSSRANEVFVVIMNLQQEAMKSRRSIEQLAGLVGADGTCHGRGDRLRPVTQP